MVDFGNIPTYKASELERLAADLLKKRCWPTVEIPIDIDLLIEKKPGVILDYCKNLKEKHHVAGMVLKKDAGSFLVLIDEDIADNNPNFYRFTVAEVYSNERI